MLGRGLPILRGRVAREGSFPLISRAHHLTIAPVPTPVLPEGPPHSTLLLLLLLPPLTLLPQLQSVWTAPFLSRQFLPPEGQRQDERGRVGQRREMVQGD